MKLVWLHYFVPPSFVFHFISSLPVSKSFKKWEYLAHYVAEIKFLWLLLYFQMRLCSSFHLIIATYFLLNCRKKIQVFLLLLSIVMFLRLKVVSYIIWLYLKKVSFHKSHFSIHCLFKPSELYHVTYILRYQN